MPSMQNQLASAYRLRWWIVMWLVVCVWGLTVSPLRLVWQLNQLSLQNVRLTVVSQALYVRKPFAVETLSGYPSGWMERGFYQLGLADQFRGENLSAWSGFHRARQLNASDVLAWLKEGESLDRMGRREEALKVWHQGQVARYFVTRGQTAVRNANWNLAELQFRLSVEIEPSNHLGYLGLGHVYQQTKQWSRAVNIYERALTIEPNNLDGHYHLGVAWLELGELAKARAQAEKAIRLEPAYVWGYILLGNTYRLERDYDQAAFWYDHLLQLMPESELGFKYLGINALERGDSASAIQYLSQTFTKASLNSQAELHFWLGQAYAQQNLRESALRELKCAAQLQPDITVFHLALANFYRATGQVDDAKSEYQVVLRLEPENSQAEASLKQLVESGN